VASSLTLSASCLVLAAILAVIRDLVPLTNAHRYKITGWPAHEQEQEQLSQ